MAAIATAAVQAALAADAIHCAALVLDLALFFAGNAGAAEPALTAAAVLPQHNM